MWRILKPGDSLFSFRMGRGMQKCDHGTFMTSVDLSFEVE